MGGTVALRFVNKKFPESYTFEASPKCIYISHSVLIINLHEQQAHTIVQFSDFHVAEKKHFRTTIFENIFVVQSLDSETFDIRRIILKRSKRL